MIWKALPSVAIRTLVVIVCSQEVYATCLSYSSPAVTKPHEHSSRRESIRLGLWFMRFRDHNGRVKARCWEHLRAPISKPWVGNRGGMLEFVQVLWNLKVRVIHLLQQSHITLPFLNISINWCPDIQTYELFIQTTTVLNWAKIYLSF